MENQKGITLIALVITIVILLILAEITIAQITGSGLFEKAKQASDESKYANAAEKVALAVNASYDESGSLNDDKLKENINKIDGIQTKVTEVTYDLTVVVDGYEFLISKYGVITAVGRNEGLPGNTTETEVGKEVALKEGWGTQTVKYIKISDGTEVKEIETVATVYAISVGSGETVPVPNGFYYVGGNLSTGVIISDNEADKYDGKIDKTTWEYTTKLKGNQFIWIPCEKSEYKKSTVWNGTTQTGTTLQNANWDTTTPKAELLQIEKYGGFYVGRYEAGLAETISEFTETQKQTGSNQIYNKSGIPQSKAEIVPWNFIDWNNAKANAESMYNNNYVSSGLITGTQWDVMLNKMVEKTDLETSDLISSSKWGNYSDTEINYEGRSSQIYYSNSFWYMPVFKIKSDDEYRGLLTTGASNQTEVYHIYDVAGNLWEWTEEDSHYKTSGQNRVIRGGSCIELYDVYPACYRFYGAASETDIITGFRVVLYIK